MTKVFVDPACNINYCSFYIKGLWEVFGQGNVVFTSTGFESLHYSANTHCLAFIIDTKRYIIDFADSNELLYTDFIEWTDVYGKVNYHADYISEKWRHKIRPVGANFGIGCFGANKWNASLRCLVNYAKCFRRIDSGFGSYLSSYLWLYKRAGIKWDFDESAVGKKSIFMVSRYWKDQPWVNNARIAFIRACRRLQAEGIISFCGGMVLDTDSCNGDCPPDVLLEHEIPYDQYVDGLKNSLLVFNTPAVHHCHGWKLPEYLATGKIILSTSFVNNLPIPLEHGKDIYFTQADEESIYQAVKHIVTDENLQKTLEIGCRRYWKSHAQPSACINHFING